MNQITLSANAKINLTLAITGKRPDGYHELSTVMQEISLSDRIVLTKASSGITISCSDPTIPSNEKNICYKAAKKYLDALQSREGVHIQLNKYIPHGAGLGGGSSDAAAVLRGLKKLFPSSLSLHEIAAQIGADTPFFLTGGTCLCQGIGEKLSSLSFPGKEKLVCVIAKKKKGLSTPEVYRLFDEMAQDTLPNRTEDFLFALQKGDFPQIFATMQNDLELPSITMIPEIGLLKKRLREYGASHAMMTGSGSAVFGFFFQRENAQLCVENLLKENIFATICTLL